MCEISGYLMNNLIYKDESYKIIGACFEVHKELGNGFSEAVYQEALEIELTIQKIPFERLNFERFVK